MLGIIAHLVTRWKTIHHQVREEKFDAYWEEGGISIKPHTYMYVKAGVEPGTPAWRSWHCAALLRASSTFSGNYARGMKMY